PAKRIVAVARFSDQRLRGDLDRRGIETIRCDLLDRAAVEALPQLANVIFMAGRKFGAEGDLPLTWAMNVHMSAIVGESFRRPPSVALSHGCAYSFVPGPGIAARANSPHAPPRE